MLNRTNRTLSANLNRLNLGTRSLAASANVNSIGVQTLRTRHVHRVVMRDGILGYQPSPIPISRDISPAIPDPSSVRPRPVTSRVVRPRVEFAAVMLSDADRTCWHAMSRATTTERSAMSSERSKRERKSFTDKRSQGDGGFGTQQPARLSLGLNAATLAALGG
jgi:hypothetical protein